MKKYFAIDNIHSFVDVITNSSTEMFVCETDKSLDAVEMILRDIIKKYNIITSLEDRGPITFEETFNKPFIYTEEQYAEVDQKWAWGYEKESNIGKVMIMGTGDNSIPYEIWEEIENIFNANSEHLG